MTLWRSIKQTALSIAKYWESSSFLAFIFLLYSLKNFLNYLILLYVYWCFDCI